MPLGVGAMPAGYGPCGAGTPVQPVEPITTAVNCRAIGVLDSQGSLNTTVQDYCTDQNGNAIAMDGTANRVFLLCCYGDVPSSLITPPAMMARQAALALALQPLTQGQQPAISNLAIVVAAKSNGLGVSVKITYTNNLTSQAT